jgi:cobyrinic acid a,c-diamide synthase
LKSEVVCAAILIGAPGSGHGKTSVTAGLARYHTRKGLRVRAFKAGPDFIDPMILERATGSPVRQLDLWMMGESGCRQKLHEAALNADIIIVEGVIGLFDGTPSTADFATTFSLPVANVINTRGMAQTAHAVAHGLATFAPALEICGYVINGVNSDRHQTMLEDCAHGPNYLGCIRNEPALSIPSRHLGLHQADELRNLDDTIDRLADAVGATNLPNVHGLVQFEDGEAERQRSGETPWERGRSAPSTQHRQGSVPQLAGVRIAVARDSGFSFVYADNLDVLRDLGAALVFFSPISDEELPPCDAVYLPGGYPELYAAQLADNHAMKTSIRQHVTQEKPLYAECGGMLYLLDSLILQDGSDHRMCGILPGSALMKNRFVSLGYQTLSVPGNSQVARAHTFHYSELKTPLPPVARGIRRNDGGPGEDFFQNGSVQASYLHVYFPSCPELATRVFSPLRSTAMV